MNGCPYCGARLPRYELCASCVGKLPPTTRAKYLSGELTVERAVVLLRDKLTSYKVIKRLR